MRATLIPVALLCLSPAWAQDKIIKTDGETLADVEVTSEGLKEIVYDQGKSKDKKVDSAEVLRIEFGKKPSLVDQADTAALSDQFFPAINDLEAFLADDDPRLVKKFPWARPYAMFRILELNGIMGELGGVAAAADRILAEAGETRYAPLALLAKARAQFDGGKGSDAAKTLGQFQKLVNDNGLGGRWSLEYEVRSVLYDDSIKGADRIKKLETLASRAGGSAPTVANAAQVGIGEELYTGNKVDDAIEVFTKVTTDGGADDRTMAAAFTGLGDCLFSQAGENGNTPEDLKDAITAYMRVVVLYPNEYVYTPKAMLYAGRSYDLMEGDENDDRARKLYTKILVDFNGTRWANEARTLRKDLSKK